MDTNDTQIGSKWRLWLSPLLLGVCFYFLVRLGFSGNPFFERVSEPSPIPGQVPVVRYAMTWRLFGLFGVVILLIGIVYQIMRQWAHYFLNRKIIVSYLFFAIIPLVTTLLIFFAIIRSWFGITSTMAFDKMIDQHAQALENMGYSLQSGLRLDPLGEDLETRIQRLIDNSIENELSGLARNKDEDLNVAFYVQPGRHGASQRYLVNMYRSHPSDEPDFMMEDTPAYEGVIPSWLQEDSWTGVVVDDGDLYLRRFAMEDHDAGAKVLIMISRKIDGSFLDQFQEHQAVRVSMHDDDGANYYTTEDSEGRWYIKLMLRPFGSQWESMAVNWESGFYDHYGEVRFDLPGELRQVLGEAADIPFFYVDQKKSSLRFILGIILLVVLCEAVAFVFGAFLVTYITRSLNTIAEGHEQISKGRLDYRLPYIGRDQLGNMGRSFNSMIANIESLMTQVTEKEKYYEELRIARDIQMSLLPNLNDLDWCSNIAGDCIPARDVGGDYYEVVQAGTGEIGIFIADVSGKGTSAAFYMAELKGVLIALRHLWDEPHELMLNLNEILRPALKSNVFISAAYLLLNPHTRRGTLARAGHCPAYHITQKGEVKELMPPGIAIGIADNAIFGKILETENFHMDDEDKVVLYTDGLDEMTFHNEMYGQERLKKVLHRNAALSVDSLRDAILDDVLTFLSSDEQDDDLTLVVAGMPSEVIRKELVASREKSRR